MCSWFRVYDSQRRALTQERLWFPLWGSRPGKKHNTHKSCLRSMWDLSVCLSVYSVNICKLLYFFYSNRSLHNTRDNTVTDCEEQPQTCWCCLWIRLGVMLNLCWWSCKVGCSAPCGVPWGPDPHTAAAFGSDLACSVLEVKAEMLLHS